MESSPSTIAKKVAMNGSLTYARIEFRRVTYAWNQIVAELDHLRPEGYDLLLLSGSDEEILFHVSGWKKDLGLSKKRKSSWKKKVLLFHENVGSGCCHTAVIVLARHQYVTYRERETIEPSLTMNWSLVDWPSLPQYVDQEFFTSQ